MFKKNKLKKIAVSLVVLLFLAFIGFSFVSAQLTPEIKYPKIGTKEITATTSLGEFISYFFGLGIIIGVLIAIGVLIYGGFLFLSSTGKPEQLKNAKDRISAAFLGLAILLGSYLILATVNPQLTIIKTELVSLNRGVVLTDSIPPVPPQGSPGNVEVTEINVSDVQKIFGKNFEPQKIEIKGKSQGRLKARAFGKPNYDEAGASTGWITNALTTTWTIKSLEVRGIGPGIYLHGDGGQQLYLFDSLGDFRAIDNFSDKAKRIEIKNLIVGGEKKTDFAAILYTDEYFKNGLRIFIEKRNEDRSGKVEPAKSDVGNVPWDKPNTTSTNEAELDITPGDKFGEVDGVSSAHIFQIGDKKNCQEIRLYKAPSSIYTETIPYCRITSASTSLVYTDRIASSSSVKLPLYKPINIEDACGDDWKDAVQGIEISGKCLVVLFEHSTSEGNFPGKRSEVFTANDADLTDNPIGKCKCWSGVLGWKCQPCTSAIAVYPLK